MLRWLLVLAMALLPWHGWAGASPAAAHAAAMQHAAPAAEATAHEVHHGVNGADCLDHLAGADHHAAAGADDPGNACPGCSMCHWCSPAGLPAMLAPPPDHAGAPQWHASAVTQFASADRDPGLKPPIS